MSIDATDPLDGLSERLIATDEAGRLAALFDDALLTAASELFGSDRAAFESLLARVRSVTKSRWQQWERSVKAKLEPERRERPAAGGWRDLLTYANEKPEPTIENCVTALSAAPEWNGVIGYNEHALTIVAKTPPPWHVDAAPGGGSKGGEWTNADDIRLVHWFSHSVGMHVKKNDARDALLLVAERNTFHPVRDYLDGLAWDGTPRLATLLRTHFRATKQPAEYLRAIALYYFTSAVARIYQPGCQADYVIVLEGTQGAQKSTACRALAPCEEFYAEHTAELGDKDSFLQLQGRWVVEFGELDSLTKHDVSRIKAYVSRRWDKFRSPYDRRVESHARQCVFIGTVNDSEYLRDSTGDRRWWGAACGDIAITALVRDRDQIWAEAVHRYRAGERWWPTREEERGLFANEQSVRYRGDTWETPVTRWLADWLRIPTVRPGEEPTSSLRGEFVSLGEILVGAIGKPVRDHEERDSVRIGKIMARLGWTRSQSRAANTTDKRDANGKRAPASIYFPPDAPEEREREPGEDDDV